MQVNCVRNWTLANENFPSGLRSLSQALHTPWLLYVPFFCPQNQFESAFRWVASYNPDHPDMVFTEPHPDDALAFYRALFEYGKRNGMAG